MKNILVTAIMSVGLLAGCNNSPAPSETNQQPKASEDASNKQPEPSNKTEDDASLPTYKVAMVDTYPPFATINEHGIITGLDVDLIKAIANEQGFKPQFVTRPWENWQSDLTKDKVDIWASGVTIKEKRKEVALYSDPYMTYNTAVLMKEDKALADIAEGSLQEYKLGAEANSTSLEIAHKLNTDPTKVKDFQSNFVAYQSLQQNKIDAIVGNNVVLANISTSFPEYKVKLTSLPEEITPSKQLGFMVKKDRNDLAQELNEGLKAIKANGEYDKVKKKWLGELITTPTE